MQLLAPVLLSVARQSDGRVLFTFEPYVFPTDAYGAYGGCQGFDENGKHVVGAFLYRDQLESGSALCEADKTHSITHCTVIATAHTTPTQYPTDPNDQIVSTQSNIVDLPVQHGHS